MIERPKATFLALPATSNSFVSTSEAMQAWAEWLVSQTLEESQTPGGSKGTN